MKTLILIAHPDVSNSSSQQYLISSGKAWTDAFYVDLQAEYDTNGQQFNIQAERERLLEYDRIILQFHLYWYQAPAILKIWLDTVFESEQKDAQFKRQLIGKQLGIVLVAGVKASQYQTGGREGRTISEMLSPYEMFARHFQMNYLVPFSVHQFQYMAETEKMRLMLQYAYYIETGDAISFTGFQQYILEKLEALTDDNIEFSTEDQILFDLFTDTLERRAEEVSELFEMTSDW